MASAISNSTNYQLNLLCSRIIPQVSSNPSMVLQISKATSLSAKNIACGNVRKAPPPLSASAEASRKTCLLYGMSMVGIRDVRDSMVIFQASNLLYVDQPTGNGFSYSSDEHDIRDSEDGESNDLYDFLQAFFKEHPQFAKNDFYITGESYAGHYIPAFASRFHRGNKAKEGIHINLKGFAIGNGLTDPAHQYKAYPDYALDMGLIKQSEHDCISKFIPLCETAIKLCGTDGTLSCMASYFVCNAIFSSIMAHAGDINKPVRDAIGVGDLDFVSCSPTVYQAMLVDWMRNLEVGIPTLLEDGLKLLVYAGEYDLICNWLGNSRWVHAMEWSEQKEFVASPEVSFAVNGSDAGKLKSHGPLSFLKVHNAGHMVPMDQPKAALEMLRRWMQGSLAEEVPADSENLVAEM
ncbi:hypothetical protein EZV62_025329 [Acer yangbiense]|uniref:Carboxypeptidase n=1 Tax=Acer yangbiense TaxID=1000413 RepID=A0A5C7GXH4_9ROSI|nr:hypothetical protein EZV62_025329 [Acer yangbiense]